MSRGILGSSQILTTRQKTGFWSISNGNERPSIMFWVVSFCYKWREKSFARDLGTLNGISSNSCCQFSCYSRKMREQFRSLIKNKSVI